MTTPVRIQRRHDRPIIFSAPMVRALLDGRKTMTRRMLRDTPDAPGWPLYTAAGKHTWVGPNGYPSMPCVVPYAVGDRLWVRETHQFRGADYGDTQGDIEWFRVYGADGAPGCYDPTFPNGWQPSIHDGVRALTEPDEQEGDGVTGYVTKRRPPIHMPRWASRITLVVTAVKVERLQAITKEDVLAEGITERNGLPLADVYAGWHEPFAALWTSIHGTGAWDANPWVVAVSFVVHRANIDNLPAAAS